jgi:hypothetical protein
MKNYQTKETFYLTSLIISISSLGQAWSNLETANESEMRCLRSSTACPIFNELVT